MNLNAFEQELGQRLDELRECGLRRELRRIDSAQSARIQLHSRSVLNFSSNDYLGLAAEPLLKEAAVEAVQRYGAGAGASRLICGSLAPHHELDERVAEFKGAQAAVCFSTGYAAALGTICALLDSDDVIILDKLVHASIVDAARLCGAKLRVFAHNDLDDLEHMLQWARKRRQQSPQAQTLVVTESVFSMDGDQAPLRDVVRLKDQYDAWLMVDEAHATGLYGDHRRGLAEALGVSRHIEIQMGTLGKAIGSAGGYICGSRNLIDYLVNRSRSLIFSTAPVPAAAAAAAAGIRFVQSDAGAQRCRDLWSRVRELVSALPSWPQPHSPALPSLPTPILPLMVGNEMKAVNLSACLLEQGIFIPAIRYPTVAKGSARLRLTVTAAHASADIATVAGALHTVKPQPSP